MTGFRNATLAEIGLVLDWAAAEGWNPGMQDAEAFYAADPGGFFVAVDAEDAPVAAISVVNHNEDYAFLGLYIVCPAHRGKGLGLALWTHALAHAGGRVVGLDGVEAQQDNYQRSGFVHAGGTTRYTGALAGRVAPEVRSAELGEVDDLIRFESAASGAEKPAYLNAWFEGIDTRRTFVLERRGGLLGFCTVRQCREGAKIGPLLAPDQASAQSLLEHAATVFPGPLTIDVPAGAAPLSALCERQGMSPGFKTARMYRGQPVPQGQGADFFAVSTLELG